MGVQVGSGRSRSPHADLNLVPFIDLLSVCIVFLIATAVWAEVSTLPVTGNERCLNCEPRPEPPAALVVHVREQGISVGRGLPAWFGRTGSAYDWTALETALETDRVAWPDERQVWIVTDDGVAYQHMIHSLDLAKGVGFEDPRLGGGP